MFTASNRITTQAPNRSHSDRRGLGSVFVLACVMTASSCSGPNGARVPGSLSGARHEEGERPTYKSFIAELRVAGRNEAPKSSNTTPSIPVAPGVAPELVAEIAPSASPEDVGDQARKNLDQVVSSLATAPIRSEQATTTQTELDDETHEQSRVEAAAKYAEGRLRLMGGDGAGAIRDLQAASRLDPVSEPIWRALAEAQLTLGRRGAAKAAFESAATLDPRSIGPLWWLGREANRDRQVEKGAGILAEARRRLNAVSGKQEDEDPAIGLLIAADLGESLAGLGYLLAASTLLEEASHLPDLFPATQYRAEVADLYRKRADFLVRAGDMACRVGAFDTASKQYSLVASLKTIDAAAIVPRRIYAMVRAGRTSEAAIVVLEDIAQARGFADDRQIPLIGYLARHAGVGPVLSEGLGLLAAEASTPTARNRALRARAAAESQRNARLYLREAVAALPSDSDAMRELLRTYKPEDARGRAQALIGVVRETPLLAPEIAELAVTEGVALEPLLKALDGEREEAAVALHALMLDRLGDPRRALASLERRRDATSVDKAGLLGSIRVLIARKCAAWEQAEASMQALRAGASASPSHRILASRMLCLTEEYAEALSLIRPLIDAKMPVATTDSPSPTATPPTQTVDVLLLGANAASRSESGSGLAETLLERALVLDPSDERVHAARLTLHSPDGPVPSDAKLSAAAIALRKAAPSSRLIRLINARDLVNRSQWNAADVILRDLIEEDPVRDGTALELLVAAAIGSGDSNIKNRVESSLRRSLKDHPDSPQVIGALTKVLASSGKADEGLALADGFLKSWPSPILAATREAIIRDVLKKPEEADRLAMQRLSTSPPTIENAAPLARLLLARGDVKGAVDALDRALPEGLRLGAGQVRSVLDVLTRLPMPENPEREGAGAANEKKTTESSPMTAEAAKTTVRLFDRLQSHSIALPAPLRLRQLRYMTLASPDDMKALYDAANKASTESKEIGLQAFDIVVEALGASDRPRRTLEFLEMASAMPGPNAEAFTRAWLGKIVTLGNASDARRLIDRSDERGLRVLLVLLSRVPADANGAALKAEAAYRMGAEVGAFSREAESEEMYRLALEYQPDHALASNDLGYGYVDKGERMEEAERLILTAYRREPNKGTITDSVGWLRYKQGRFVDSTDPTTGALIEGATTLLLRASAIDEDSRNDALIHEHLGDALWRAGRTEEAKRAWQSSESISGATLANLGIGGREVQNSPRLANFKKLYEKSFEGVKAKLRAANEGKVPDVAPLAPGK